MGEIRAPVLSPSGNIFFLVTKDVFSGSLNYLAMFMVVACCFEEALTMNLIWSVMERQLKQMRLQRNGGFICDDRSFFF
jgi:hypothetical protein